MIPESFHLLRPQWLWAAPLLLALWGLLWRRQIESGQWRSHCDPHLLPHLLHGEGGQPRRLPLLLLGLGWLLALLALAGPVWERLPQPLFKPREPVVIVLDLSRSMAAEDIRPSRLARAKQKVLDLLKRSGSGQTGLVAFAGDAFVVSPLTDDAATVAALIPALTPETMPVQGSRPDRGLRQAAALLDHADLGAGTVVLITDGDAAPSESFRAAQALAEAGHRLSVLGVGTPQGGPVPAPGGGFVLDGAGQPVLARLTREPLQALTGFGVGVYAELTADDSDLERLLGAGVQRQLPGAARALERTSEQWREMGPWLLVALVPLAALAFRRGWLFVLAFLFVGLPPSAHAFEWADLWQRPDQRGAAALTQGDAARAAALFESPAWQGTAHYRNNDFAAAADAFARVPGADGAFNRGNALARQGELKAAMAAFEAALKQDPDHADARFNRDLVKKLLEQQEQQQDQQQQDQQQQDQQQQDQQQQDQQQQQQSGQGDQDQEQEGKQGASQEQPDAADQSGESGQEQEEKQQEKRKQQEGKASEKEADEAQEADEEGDETAAQALETEENNREESESDQAMEQWLTRIPDDPGGLLRRKFYREFQRRRQQRQAPNVEAAPW